MYKPARLCIMVYNLNKGLSKEFKMLFENNKKYEFEVNASFDNLPNEVVNNLFQRGTVASEFFEAWLPKIFTNLIDNRDGNGNADHDLFNTKISKKIEVRCFTKYGASLIPSGQIGSGRKFNQPQHLEKCYNVDFLLVNINLFPKIEIFGINGNEAYKKYFKKITYTKGKDFFKVA